MEGMKIGGHTLPSATREPGVHRNVKLSSPQTIDGQRFAQLLPSPSVNVAPSRRAPPLGPLLASVHISPSPDHTGLRLAPKSSQMNLHVCQNVYISGRLLKICIGKKNVINVTWRPSARMTESIAVSHDPPHLLHHLPPTSLKKSAGINSASASVYWSRIFLPRSRPVFFPCARAKISNSERREREKNPPTPLPLQIKIRVAAAAI